MELSNVSSVLDRAGRKLRAAMLGAGLIVGGCTYPDGSPNPAGTLALGLAAAAGVAVIASEHHRPRYYYDRGYHGHGHGYYGRGYGRGYGRRGYYYKEGDINEIQAPL